MVDNTVNAKILNTARVNFLDGGSSANPKEDFLASVKRTQAVDIANYIRGAVDEKGKKIYTVGGATMSGSTQFAKLVKDIGFNIDTQAWKDIELATQKTVRTKANGQQEIEYNVDSFCANLVKPFDVRKGVGLDDEEKALLRKALFEKSEGNAGKPETKPKPVTPPKPEPEKADLKKPALKVEKPVAEAAKTIKTIGPADGAQNLRKTAFLNAAGVKDGAKVDLNKVTLSALRFKGLLTKGTIEGVEITPSQFTRVGAGLGATFNPGLIDKLYTELAAEGKARTAGKYKQMDIDALGDKLLGTKTKLTFAQYNAILDSLAAPATTGTRDTTGRPRIVKLAS